MRAAIAAEWVKFRSYPLCLISCSVTVCLPFALSLLLARVQSDTKLTDQAAMYCCLRGMQLGQIGIVVVCAAISGQEFHGSSMRTAFLAVPRRTKLLCAKLCLSAMVSGVVCLVSGSLGYIALVTIYHISISQRILTHAIVLQMGACVSWILVGCIALCLSIVARSLLVSIAVLGVLIAGASQLLLMLTSIAKYLPDMATMRVFTDDPTFLSPAAGFTVQLVWAIVMGGGARSAYFKYDIR